MSNIADRTRSRTINPSLLSINSMITDSNEDNKYSNDNVNNPQYQDYSGGSDIEQQGDEESTSTFGKVMTSTTQEHSLSLQEQQPSIIDDNQPATSLPNISLNVATQVHIQHLLDGIVDFSGRNEDVRTWIQRIELLFDLADYTKFKWIKLTALHLTDHALCWYNANKNKFHDWDVFCQMLIKQYTANRTPATTTSQTIQVDDNNLTIPRQNDLLVTEIPTIRENHSSTNLLNKEFIVHRSSH
ncbi:unnamed protein product [Didymodactylos carnosus]|uniref:Retrotransposon gag domain-containing protein n=1 Tax=Didymodactylos carnosus TaxID=1234261 RepID=A0A8S2WBK0_9BILA|nr:unnamed protein product [Didymodactylos carnosus]